MKFIDFEVTVENTNEDLKKLYQILRPEIKLEEIKLDDFKEGVINSIVKVDDSISNDPLVMRTYTLKLISTQKAYGSEDPGIDLSQFQNRRLELAVLKEASDLGITVKLIASYKNGFIYKYIDGDLNNVQLYNEVVAKKTATKMAQFHKIDLKGLASEETFFNRFEDDEKNKKLQAAFDLKQKESSHEEFKNFLPLFSQLNKESNQLFATIRDNGLFGKICLCHNDLNLTNLLIEKSTKEPIFIDFEWSDTSYQLYDIAYHLYAMGGIFCQYFNGKDVPEEESIKKWLTFYYEESHRLDNIQMSEKEFSDFIENETKKILIIMNYVAIQFVIRAMFFEFDFRRSVGDVIKNYCVQVYKDFIKRKEKYMKLVETIKK